MFVLICNCFHAIKVNSRKIATFGWYTTPSFSRPRSRELLHLAARNFVTKYQTTPSCGENTESILPGLGSVLAGSELR